MKQALGLVEIQGLSTAITAADEMVKAANVKILEIENTKGLGYMTIKVAGDVGAVNASVNVGCQIGRMYQKLISWKVIPRPSDYVEQTFCKPEEEKEIPKPEETAEVPKIEEAVNAEESEKAEEPAKAEEPEKAEESEKAEEPEKTEELISAGNDIEAEPEEIKTPAAEKKIPVKKGTPRSKK